MKNRRLLIWIKSVLLLNFLRAKIEISMNDFVERYGRWALVAGGAGGIGAAFSEALASKGMNLVMVDRDPLLLEKESGRLTRDFAIEIVSICLDLSRPDVWMVCMDSIRGCDCRLLVYVPAYTSVQPFLTYHGAQLDCFIDLNCRTPLHLCHAFAKSLADGGKPGGILLLGSLAGLVAPVLSSVYAGTKAFNILLAESLRSEFLHGRIDVGVCCAGITSTETFWSGNPERSRVRSLVAEPRLVAGYALENLGKKTILIPGWRNRLSYFFLLRCLPRNTASKLVSRAMKRIYPGVVFKGGS
jgi:uncharacterized protein